MKVGLLTESVARFREKPFGTLVAFVCWIVLESVKHRFFAWVNERIDRERAPIILAVQWIMARPVALALTVAAAYISVVIIRTAFSSKIGEIGFVHPGEPMGHRWTVTMEGGDRPLFSAPVDAPIPNSVTIVGPWDPGIDHEVEPYPGFCKRLKYAAHFPGHAAVYTLVRVLAPDGSTHQKWLQHVLGRGDEPIADMDSKDERKVFVSGRVLKGDWILFNLSLTDEVKRAYQQEAYAYSALLKIRLRGSLSISPIELYRD